MGQQALDGASVAISGARVGIKIPQHYHGSLRQQTRGATGIILQVVGAIEQIGGGTAPGVEIPSVAVAILPPDGRVDALEATLRRHEPPIVARIARERLLLDVRTLEEADFPRIAACLRAAEEARA